MTTTTAQATKISHDGDLNWASEGSMDRCVQCARPVGSRTVWVAVYAGGSVWAKSAGEPDRNSGGWMGWFPVGMSCANQFAPGVLYATLENDNHDAPHKNGAVA